MKIDPLLKILGLDYKSHSCIPQSNHILEDTCKVQVCLYSAALVEDKDLPLPRRKDASVFHPV